MVRATVHIMLSASDARYRLPASGTPSLLFRFTRADGSEMFLGARASSSEIVAFAPGTKCQAELDFWADEPAREVVKTGASFEVHYPRQVGTGEVIGVLDG